MRPVPVHAVHCTAKPGDAVHVHGVCTSVESVHQQVASRTVKCPHCGESQAHLQLAGIPLQQCCAEGSTASLVAWEENATGRVLVPVSMCATLLSCCGIKLNC